MCALGSQDGTVSFWLSDQARSPFVAKNLFQGAVFDISWSEDGKICAACASDGTVAIFVMDGIFGTALSEDEKGDLLDKFGGRLANRRDVMILPESVDQLRMERLTDKLVQPQASNTISTGIMSFLFIPSNGLVWETTGQSTSINPFTRPIHTTTAENLPDQKVQQQQRITITKDGRKRVQPVMVTQSPRVERLSEQLNQGLFGTSPSLSITDRQLLSKVGNLAVNLEAPELRNSITLPFVLDSKPHLLTVDNNSTFRVKYSDSTYSYCHLCIFGFVKGTKL